MQYANHRTLRESMYRDNVTRASEFGPAELDNTLLISEILALRAEEIACWALRITPVSLAPKMADSPSQVIGFLRDMAARSNVLPSATAPSWKPLPAKSWIWTSCTPGIWPGPAKKLRVARYDFSEQEVKAYFSEARVLDGLFGIIASCLA